VVIVSHFDIVQRQADIHTGESRALVRIIENMTHRKEAGVAGGQIEFIIDHSKGHSVSNPCYDGFQRLVSGQAL